jgi:hypothetical protein
MTQGASNNTGSIHDLDALLAKRILKPKPVRLAGHVYSVRTDLTGAEVVKYYALADEKKDEEALALIVGAEDAKKLNSVLNDLPRDHMNAAVQEIMVLAGVANGTPQTGAESEGE